MGSSSHLMLAVSSVAVLLLLLTVGNQARNTNHRTWSFTEFTDMMRELKESVQKAKLLRSGMHQGYRQNMMSVPALLPVQEERWAPTLNVGDVVGVAVNLEGDPVVLHRGGRIWEPRTFNESHYMKDLTRLPENTVIVLDKYSAQSKETWGSNLFLMPHGITIDAQGHIWITDVGLHQVIKFSGVNHHPLLTMGEAEVPGGDRHHFCQPTSTAVSSSGEVFVADGYCNNRILWFGSAGDYKGEFSSGSDRAGNPNLPHGLSLDETETALCVADRESRRVVCYRVPQPEQQAHSFGAVISLTEEPYRRRVFDVKIIGNGQFVAVGGSVAEGSTGVAFSGAIGTSEILNNWGPRQGLHNPHAIAVSPDKTTVYVAEMQPNALWKFKLSQY